MRVKYPQQNPFMNWTEENQCFGKYATDELGEESGPQQHRTCRWCAIGWLHFMRVPQIFVTQFNQWCMANFNGQPLTVLNDINYWKPRDFEFAWDKFVKDLEANPQIHQY